MYSFNVYIKGGKSSKMNELFLPKKLQKVYQIKLNVSRRKEIIKIRSGMNEKETEKMIEKNQ